ncbi:Uncharacterised protein [Neisseria gonorrhoeae]|uniref:Uncharacterized protein n=1 Tax=Neisseria gonorrhoeae TaxID=485 RepID=A0A378VYY1_NEIGO|nr:Uncharacterised protein [Neisseria gonorrhoeae]
MLKNSLQCVFQCFTCTEFKRFGGGNGQRLAGFGVAALAFRTFADVESTETDQSNGVALFQGVGYCVGSGIQSFCAAALEISAS